MQSRTEAQAEVVTAVRTGATLLKGVRVEQRTNDAPALYLQIFNVAAASVTIGTTAPVLVIPVPAGNTIDEMMRLAVQFQGNKGGHYLSTALSYAVTTTHDGSTAPDAGDEPVVVVDYEAVGA